MNKPVILVVEDEVQLQKILTITLESNDYKVLIAETGKEAITLAASYTPDLIVLDIGLPDISGHDVLTRIREWYDRGIIILSALNNEGDIVSALDHGANDYVTKPFRTSELLARIRAVLRKNQITEQTKEYTFGSITMSFTDRIVKRDGESIKLTATEYNLLHLFVMNEGKVLTHRYLLKEVWGVGQQMETQYLRVFVGNLRKKLEENPNQPKHILTESGVGYRFV
jgi:two-component system KDP operon response regulator KdpE